MTSAATMSKDPPLRPGRHRLMRIRSRTAWVLLAPALVLTAGLLAVPVVYAVYLSLRGYAVTGGAFGVREETFVGLGNFATAVTNPELVRGAGNVVIYGLLTIPTTLGLALLLALLLDLPRVRLGRLSRIVIFIPFAVPGVIASLLWGFMYLPGVSPARDLAERLGLAAPDFFTPASVFGSLANIAVWGGIGFNMIILFTALRGIPAEIYDAARIDGASERVIAWRIKIPLIVPGLVLTGLFSLVGTLQVFSEPTTLSNFTNVISSTWAPMMTIYRDAFVLNSIHAASAGAILVSAVTLVLSVLLLKVLQARAFRENS